LIAKNFDQSGLLEVKYSEELFSLLERNDSHYNLTSICTEKFVIVDFITSNTGIKGDDLSSNTQTPVLSTLKGWWYEEFTSKGFKMRINFFNPLLVS